MNQLVSPAAVRPALSAGPDWWRGAVIYQVYPRSFQDSDGDGIGDLKGVTARLPYLADLGVDAVWLSPFFKSPMKDFGYDVSDYCDVDPMFGTLDDFKVLVDRAHDLGLRVLIDQVLSHTSDQHPWFVESRQSRDNPRADWFVWTDAKPDGTPPNNWLSVFGGSSWEWDSRRRQYYLHNFLRSQPDLNFHNPLVQAALLGVLKFWLDLGVDGFRFDTVNFYFHDPLLNDNPPFVGADPFYDVPAVNPYSRQDHLHDKTRPENLDFLKRVRALLDKYPGSTAVGEVGDGARSLQTMIAYTSSVDRLHMSYTFDLLGGEPTRAHFDRTIRTFEAAAGDAWPCWALSNHDVVRHATRCLPFAADPLARGKLMAAIQLTLRGSTCLYQGDELGLTEAEIAYGDLVDPYGIRFWPECKGRDGCRTPMVWEADAPNAGFSSTNRTWLPVPAEHREKAVDRQTGVAGSQLEFYRAMLAFRRAHPALRLGTLDLLPSRGEVFAYRRAGGGESVLCVFNMGREPASFDLPDGVEIETPASELGFPSALAGRTVVLPPEAAFIAIIK